MKLGHLIASPIAIKARTFARNIGLIRLLAPLLRSEGYEEAFSSALLGEIKPGDCVWDIGANVGFYTAKLSDLAGPQGMVVAFEPSPRNFSRLLITCAPRKNVVLENSALGRECGVAAFEVSAEESGVTDRLASVSSASSLQVQVLTGDEYVRRSQKPPDVVKVDVEGFEDDVLEGLHNTIGAKRIRCLFVEVHFGNLAARGRPNAPISVCESLSAAGYDVRWLDHSHFVAKRGDS
jgi:FkbM family methyltransferase